MVTSRHAHNLESAGCGANDEFLTSLRAISILQDLRGAWRDRDTNDIFAHCSLIFYFLDLQIFQLCLSFWTVSFDLVLFKIPSGKRKNIRKTTQNALAPSIFIVLSIVLKLGTPLLQTQVQNTLLQNFLISLLKSRYGQKTRKTLFCPTRSALTKHNFFPRSKLKNCNNVL